MNAERNQAEDVEPSPMRSYTCFIFNDTGEIIRVEATDCADDGSARRWADVVVQHPEHNSVELWLGDRFVARCQRRS